MTEVAELVRDFRFLPEGIDSAQKSISFIRTTRAELAEQAFLDPRWRPASGERSQAPIATVIDATASQPGRPRLNFIWHTSFCCSTLLARAIDRPGCNLSLREPQILVAVADAVRARAVTDGRLPEVLPAAVLRLLARPAEPGSQITVKPSNFANILVREAARSTDGNALFLYSSLPSFLTSIAKGGVRLRKFARRLFGTLVGDLGQRLPWSSTELMHMTDLEIAALVWHMQIAEFQRGWAAYGGGRTASLDCEAFLAAPTATLAAIDAFFGLDLGGDHIREVGGGPLFRQDSKNPARDFSAEDRAREARAVSEQLGADLDQIVSWSYQACPATPRGAPMANALVA
ncbi:MAG TPA: hypothetical protein VGG68_07205 [Caulobacteraceae bacterium]